MEMFLKRSDHYLTLHRAVENDDVVKLHKALMRGEDAAQVDHMKNTPLMLAVKTVKHKIVALLLKHGIVGINVQDVSGKTALYHASAINYLSCIVRLLSRSADPNVADANGETPLMVGCRLGHLKTVQQLVRHTVTNLDLQDACGRTALSIASFHGHTKIVDDLLEHFASTSLCNHQGQTPLVVAAEQGHFKCVQLLLEHPSNPDQKDNSGRTALQYACARGCVDMVKALVHASANMMVRSEIDESTMLILSARKGFSDIVHFFLENTAMDVNAVDCAHRSALYYACEYPTMFATLEAHGANVYEKDYSHKTILMRACEIGCLEIVTKLLAYDNMQVNAIDSDGNTALMFASLYGKVEVVSLLLDHGADPVIADNEEDTPLTSACMFGQEKVVECLLSRVQYVGLQSVNGQWMNCLHQAARRGHANIVKMLLDAGLSPTDRDLSDKSPLHYACEFRHISVVRVLLQSCQPTLEIMTKLLNMRDATHCTALFHACDQNATECALFLLKLNADPNRKGEHGMTPLMAAASYGNQVVVEALCQVLDKDAINERSDRGHTALYVACEGKHAATAMHLMQKGANPALCSNVLITPLMLTAMTGNTSTAEAILQGPGLVSIDFQDASGLTALYHACLQGHDTMVELLLLNGANVLLASDSGVTPLIMSAADGYDTIVHLLLVHVSETRQLVHYIDVRDESMQTALHKAVSLKNTRILELLIRYGATVHTVDRRGHTPLITASIKSKNEAVRCLLTHPDIHVNYANDEGKTALYYAITYCRLPLVRMLLEHGADMAMLFHDFLIWTTGFTDFFGMELIRLIFSAPGVDLDAVDLNGQTTLYLLAKQKQNRTDVIAHLLRQGANPWIGPMCSLPIVVARHRSAKYVLNEYMREPLRLGLLQKSRVLKDIYTECRYVETPNAKRMKCLPIACRLFERRVGTFLPLPHLGVHAECNQMDNVLKYVITAMNDDVFQELSSLMKVKWDN